jgi:hypothetical protein
MHDWRDRGIEVDLNTLTSIEADGSLTEVGKAYLEAALATGAFPFGLRPRELSWPADRILHLALPQELGKFDRFLTRLKKNKEEYGNAHFVYVDGGMLNNEPFEIARWAIRDPGKRR